LKDSEIFIRSPFAFATVAWATGYAKICMAMRAPARERDNMIQGNFIGCQNLAAQVASGFIPKNDRFSTDRLASGLEFSRSPQMAVMPRLVGIRPEPSDKLVQVLGWQGFPGKNQLRLSNEQRYRLEIVQYVVLERIESAVQHVRSHRTRADSVAIGCRPGDAASPNAAACAGHVLDNDRLTKRCPHSLGHDAPNHVRRTARRESDDERDRS